MAQKLPPQPNLEQYKKQAKELVKAHRAKDFFVIDRIRYVFDSSKNKDDDEIFKEPFQLSDAQFLIAKEHGFKSWAEFKNHIEITQLNFRELIETFVKASCGENFPKAQQILKENPSIARATFHTNLVLGNVENVKDSLEKNSKLAIKKGGPNNWFPLSYVTLTKHQINNSKCAQAMVEIAQILLAQGADPNTTFPWEDPHTVYHVPVLNGAVSVVDNVELARTLLEAGANPNDSESIYHAVEANNWECLELLVKFGGDLSGVKTAWGNTPLYFIAGLREEMKGSDRARHGFYWLLEHGADPNVTSFDSKEVPLHVVARAGKSVKIVEALIDHGAEINKKRRDGRTPYAIAMSRGHRHVSEFLKKRGADISLSLKDEFMSYISHGESEKARAFKKANPQIMQELDEEDKRLITELASFGKFKEIQLALEMGFPIDIKYEWGNALHHACWFAYPETVRILLENNADTEFKNDYGGTALGTTQHGSIYCQNPFGNYPETLKILVRGGGDLNKTGLWGSEEVIATLRDLGVQPTEESS